MDDKNTLCNRALGLVKNSEIVDISEGSPRAEACRLYFDSCAGIALAYYDWSFARKFYKPAQFAQKYDGFEYTYIYPSDCVAVRQYLDKQGNIIDVRECRNILSDNNAMRLLLSSKEIATIVYTARVLNTKIWSDDFDEAFTYLLASKVISKVTGEKDHNEKYQIYEAKIELAAYHDRKIDAKTYNIDFMADYKPSFVGKGF